MTDLIKNFFATIKRTYQSMRSIFRKTDGAKKADPNLALQQVVSARKTQGLPTKAQIKYFPQLLSDKEKQIATVAVVIVLIAGVLLGRELLNSTRLVMPAVGGEYTEGLIGYPQLINPLYSLTSDVDTDLTRLVYSGLMRYDTVNGLVPDLAESYEISEDGKTYTFVINDNARWHDGKKVLADDVIFTINAIQNPDYRSPLELGFKNVTVEQIDDKTVSFTLEEEFTPFLSFLTVGILPSHLWQEIAPFNAGLAELNRKPIGSGPYIFEKLIRDSNGTLRSYEFVRNSDYYREVPYIESLTFKFYSDIQSGVDALNNHNIEGLSFVPTNNLELFEKDGSIKMIFAKMHQYSALFFNQDNNSILADDDIRQALAIGTDKQAIIDTALLGHGQTINSFILEGMLGYSSDISASQYDPETAKQLLESAGWIPENQIIVEADEADTESEPTEKSTTRMKDDVFLAFEIVTIDAVDLVATANEIKSQWSDLGIDVTVNVVTATTFQSDILKNRNYDILLATELYGIDSDPYAFWHSSQTDYPGLNLSDFADGDADDLIEDARANQDIDDRTQNYLDLQNIVIEEMPAIFLYQSYYAYAVASKIQGITIENMTSPADRFSRINEWHIKTKKVFRRTEDKTDEENTDNQPEETITDDIIEVIEE